MHTATRGASRLIVDEHGRVLHDPRWDDPRPLGLMGPIGFVLLGFIMLVTSPVWACYLAL